MNPTETSPELRRLGRAGPNAGEMELLRAATLDADQAAAAWTRWIAEFDVDTAYHRSTDLLAAVSSNVPREALGDEADRLRGIRRRSWADNQFGFQVLGDAIDLLDAAGIESILAKGAALATSVYADAGTRAMHDCDIWVGPERLAEACELLFAAGWRRLDPVEGPFFHAVAVVAENGRSIDVHRHLVFPRFTSTPEMSWWDRAVPHEIAGRSTRRLSNADELLLTVLHGVLTNSSSASRWPIDVVVLARSADEIDGFWDAVVAAANELGVGSCVADALDMCRGELGADIAPDVIGALRAGPSDRGLAVHWALCRRGVTPEWRVRRYWHLARSQGRTPSIRGYVDGRFAAIRTRGLRSVLEGRVERVRQIITDRTRD